MERRRVGAVEVIALIDNVQGYAAPSVYPEAGDTLSRYSGYLDGEGKVSLNFASFLLVDGSTTVLVDTGWGPEHAGRLMEELAASGVAREAVDQVIFTHLHGDHTGWNLDRATGTPLFPRATYIAPKKDWEFYSARDPQPASFTRDMVPLERLGRLEFLDGERSLSTSLTAIHTPGHTPGHTSVLIASNGEHGVVLGDVNISPIDVEEPDWPISFDWDHAIAAQTRRAMMSRTVVSNALIAASHLPVPGFGRYASTGSGHRWVAG